MYENERYSLYEIKQQHLKLLKKAEFLSAKNVPNLSIEEHKILNEKGFWLSALGRQKIAAFTSAQKHFVSVYKGKAKPESFFERTWVKYQNYLDSMIESQSELKRIDDLEKRKGKSKIIIKNAIMNGEGHYLKIRKQEIESGYITEDEANQIFEKYSKFMPAEDMTKKIGATEGVPTTGGHDPYR